MKSKIRSLRGLTRFSILFCMFGLLLLPLRSSLCAAGQAKAGGEFTIGIVVGKGTAGPGRHYISFSVSISPTSRAIAIDKSNVVLNRTQPIPLVTSLSTMGRLHIHEKNIRDGDALGSSVTLEVFVRKTGVLPPDAPLRRIAAAIIDLSPTIDWVYPTHLSIVNIHGDHSVSPPSYPPLRVTWSARGVSGPYELIVQRIVSGSPEVFRESGIMTESYSLPASIFVSGERFIAHVKCRNGLPIRATTSFAFHPDSGFFPHAMCSFTVVKD